jgi:hypothetical protein
VTRQLAVLVVWGALIALVVWSLYGWFVFVLLPPTAIGLCVGAALATHQLTSHAGTLARRLLRSVANAVAVVGSALGVAYFVWWGLAYDAAESMTELDGPDLEPWLFGGSVTCIAVSVFIPGVAWLWSGADDETRTRNILLGRQRL